MAENKRYYWLKFKEDFFSSKRIKKLRKLGADYVIIYLKMQLKALKNNGYLTITGIEDSVADEIALDIDEDTDKVQITLSYLQACGLVETENDMLFLPYVQENTGSETASTQRSRECRARQKEEKLLQCNEVATEVQPTCNVEKEIEKDIDIELDKELEIEKETPPPHNNVSYLYFGDYKRVQLTKEELRALYEQYEDREVLRVITRLDLQIAKKGSFYPNHYETLRQWIEEDRKKAGQA